MKNTLLHKTILLIDPDTSIASLIRQAMGDDPVTVIHYSSGSRALNDLLTIAPDFILSEYITDDMTGGEVYLSLRDSRHNPETGTTPFVLFSEAAHREKHGDRLFRQGISGWITKPFSSHELREIIENISINNEVIDRNRELRAQVKRSEYRYRDLLENANDFIFTLDDQGAFVYLNNRFTPLTGLQKEEWKGKPFLSLITPEFRHCTHQFYEMAHHGRARIFEAPVITNGAEETVLSFNITPILEKGSITGSIGIARDVTEKKKMEREILDLKNFNESIIQSMEAGLLTTDLDGVITSLNAGGERILGWKSGEVVGKRLDSVLQKQEAAYLIGEPPPVDSPLKRRETELMLKSGKKISIGFTSTDRIDNQNQKVGTIVSFRDITQIKQMQSEVLRMDRLVSLGVLASGIAHEIKNPLAGIKTMAQACEEEFEPDDSRKEYLVRIVRQVNRLDDLLKTFFAYARPKPPDQKPHQLSEILEEVSNLVNKKMDQLGIAFEKEFPPDLPDILVDSQQMQQVFLNLILNSMDAMPAGGSLHIRARIKSRSDSAYLQRQSTARPRSRRAFVETEIRDTGSGIPPEKLETIFDPFFTTKPSGLGLGLSIVYRIIKEHHGDIRVKSEPGKNTTFTILLPAGDTTNGKH